MKYKGGHVKRNVKFLLNHEKKVIFFTLVFIVILFFLMRGIPGMFRQLPIYSVKTNTKTVSLTFDAAWGNEDTQLLIDILDNYNVKVTFFMIGEWLDSYPESVKALADAGHEIMNHSDQHVDLTKLTPQEISENIRICNEKISSITKIYPTLFRAPLGAYNDELLDIAKGMGMYTIQWDVDSLDWKELSVEEITGRVLGGVSSGSIVLFHNGVPHTPEALPGIIEALKDDGYEIVPVSELILKENYRIDHNGRQRHRYLSFIN